MSRECQITGKKRLVGNRVSHSNIKTKHEQQINLQEKRFLLEPLGVWVPVRVTTKGIRTITKYGGLAPYLLKTPLEELHPNLRRWKKALTGRLKIACG